MMVFSAAAFGQVLSPSADTEARSPTTSENIAQRYPSGAIKSVEMAERALAEVDKERERIELQFVEDERACYPKFFTSACLDAAKEKHRLGLAQIQPIEVEANAFKRRAKVADRDKILADKRAEEESQAAQRAKEQKEKEIATVKKEADIAQRAKKSAEQNSTARAAETIDRAAQHQAKLQRAQADEAAGAEKRAANVAAYEKKGRDAQARQREIAEKKAQKEREKKAKEPALPVVPPASGSPAQPNSSGPTPAKP